MKVKPPIQVTTFCVGLRVCTWVCVQVWIPGFFFMGPGDWTQVLILTGQVIFTS